MAQTKANTNHLPGPSEQLAAYWELIKLHGWLIYFVTLVLTAAAVVGIALLPNAYRATTTIMVDPQKVPDELVPATVRSPLTERLQTISQEVLSSTHLQKVVDENHLYPELRKSMTSDQILDYMRNQIQIAVKHASGSGPASFTITYEGRDPVVTARVTTELATGFINWNVESRSQLTTNTAEFLDSRLQEAQVELERQEAKVREFKMQHLGEMPEQSQSNIAALSQLHATFSANNDALNRLEQERMQLEQLPQMAQGAQLRPMPTTERTRLEDEKLKLEGQLFELRRRYTVAHPEVIEAQTRLDRVNQQLADLPVTPDPAPEENKEPSAQATAASVRLDIIARESRRLDEEQKRIQSQIAAYQVKLDAVPLREQQFVDLTRGYDTAKEQYRSLLTKKYSADMAADLEKEQQGENFTVLDPALVPERPYKPNRKVMIVAAFLGSLFFSVILVLAKDQMRATVKSERQVRTIMGQSVPILATIPVMPGAMQIRRRRRYFAAAVLSTVATVLMLAAFIWYVHPIL
jgi:succinoglycan biosynthesis transport protein ExoP